MPRLLLLLAVAAVAYLLVRRVRSLPPQRRRAEYLKLALGALLVLALFLTLTGRMHWVGAALTGLLVMLRQSLPLLIRLFPMLASLRAGSAGASSSRTSTVQSAYLRMHLDHDSGRLDGEVLSGSFAGRRLSDMNRSQLEELRRQCRDDNDSLQLLDSYLRQRFPGEDDFTDTPPPGSVGSSMTRTEALAVLGLEEGASREDIVAAHRRLMQKLHPDRGGNDYLAAKINQAKDLLLD